MSIKENLVKIKKQSIVIIILGILTTAFGLSQFIEAEKAIATLNETVLK